ncbi:hypothetical protein [Gemmata sp.]|uniref:hypothetical protein n=1 Tax=Gemmata sp. TaxID=1914242 RepID=UPI003F724649
MSVTIICPHCEQDFPPGKLTQSGRVHCAACDGWFTPTPAQGSMIEAAQSRVSGQVIQERSDHPGGDQRLTPAQCAPAPTAIPESASVRDHEETGDATTLEDIDNPWVEFGSASRRVKFGIVIELAAGTAFLLVQLLFLGLAANRPPDRPPDVKSTTERSHIPLSMVGLAVGLLGSGLVAAGRSGQAKVAPGRMGAGSPVAVASVGWISLVAAAAAIGMFGVAFGASPAGPANPNWGRYAWFAAGGMLVAFYTRLYADIGSLIHLGVVSGVMPDRRLRDRVSVVNIVFQVSSVCYLVLTFAALFTTRDDLTRAGRNPAQRPLAHETPTEIAVLYAAIYLAVVLYGVTNLSLHAAACRAADEWEPDVDE